MDVTGFVVYFSDRRGNRDFGADNAGERSPDDVETGEFGFEDFVNRADANSRPSGTRRSATATGLGPSPTSRASPRWAEDVNAG